MRRQRRWQRTERSGPIGTDSPLRPCHPLEPARRAYPAWLWSGARRRRSDVRMPGSNATAVGRRRTPAPWPSGWRTACAAVPTSAWWPRPSGVRTGWRRGGWCCAPWTGRPVPLRWRRISWYPARTGWTRTGGRTTWRSWTPTTRRCSPATPVTSIRRPACSCRPLAPCGIGAPVASRGAVTVRSWTGEPGFVRLDFGM